MKKAVLAFLLILIFLFITQETAYARHRRQKSVLGTSTVSAQIPPTVEGPGFILPDSPLFFLDKFKQRFRLIMAFTPETRSEVYKNIAGERMAELRLMIAKNNQSGIKTALDGVSENLKSASSSLSEAKLTGRNVELLAKKINDDIKLKRITLDILENGTVGEINARVVATQEAVDDAKTEVEDLLPESELENEIEESLEREIEDEVEEASESAEELELDLEDLKEEASESAKKALKRREEALKRAIEAKNETLKKVEEKRLELEKKKQEKLLKANEEAAEAAKSAVENAKKAAEKFREAHKKAEKIKTSDISEKTEVRPTMSNTSPNARSNSVTNTSEEENEED